jgi:hypothetical protein
VKTIDFIFSCNEITAEILPLIRDKLSPSSILSIIGSNYRINNAELVERYRNEFLSLYETQQKNSVSFGNVNDGNKTSIDNTMTKSQLSSGELDPYNTAKDQKSSINEKKGEGHFEERKLPTPQKK